VPDLDPHDDYPDSADLLTTEQIQSGILPLNFKQALAAPTEAFRAWAAASPSRSLHPAGDVLMDDLEPLPIVGYMMDGNDGQVMIELPSGQRTLSGTLEILPGHSFVPAGSLAAFRGVDYTLSSVHVPMVLRWFVEGWKAAGGAKLFPLLANISYHDGGGMTKLPSAAGRRQR
jgi:hypothetical protein